MTGPELARAPGAPAIPEPPWYRPEAAPRVRLTREAIVDAALSVLDQVGMDGLSMRRVAQELGTGAASLYWHVRNKEELFQLVFDRVTREMVLPEPDPTQWKEQLKLLGYEMRKALSRHRDVARISFGRVPTGPQMALLIEWLFTLLQPVGIPDRVIAYIGDVAGLYVGAFCYEESLGISSPTGEDLPPEQIVEMFRGYMQSLPAERFPRTLASLDLIFDYKPEERFEFALDLMISGMEKFAARASQPEATPE
jgi:TetR/AcrR family tetracycline transcriptional repressor